MARRLASIAAATVLTCVGCATRGEVARPQATPVPKTAPRNAPAKASVRPSAAGTPAGSPQGAAPVPSPAPAPEGVSGKPSTDGAPPATASAYVYSPQQAVSAAPAASPPPAGAPQEPVKPARVSNPPAAAPSAEAPAPPHDEAEAAAPGELVLTVVASERSIAAGAIVTMDVLASSNAAIVDAPLHLSFDPNVVAFVDGAPGDFLTQGGSSIVFFADGLSRPGDVAVAAGRVERAQGAMGTGLLCRVRFRGVAAGTTAVVVGQAKAWGTRGQELPVDAAGATVIVR